MEGLSSSHIENYHDKELNENQNNAILSTMWGSVNAWREQMLVLGSEFVSSQRKFKKRNRDFARTEFILTLINGRDSECISQRRMDTSTFRLLCQTLRDKKLLRDTRQVFVEEAVAEFMHTIAHSVRNMTNSFRFFRSGETISRHFHEVLYAINRLAPEYFVQAGPYTPKGPHGFEDCIGALDGTHVPVHVPTEIQGAFRNRKGVLSQNVLGACGFDMNFQYILPGWEGSATDARVLQNALLGEDPLIVPQVVMSPKKKNIAFNALMDEELLDLMYERVLLGRKADRGFKMDAYKLVAVTMTEHNEGAYILTSQAIQNWCKHLKKNYGIVTEILNASGFGYDITTKRVIASDDVWIAWLQGHPKALPYKSSTIDYDKLTICFGKDVATGQYARSATTAPSHQSIESGAANFSPLEADSDVGLTDQIGGCRLQSSSVGTISRRTNPRKRNSELLEIIQCIERSSEGLTTAIRDVADTLRLPKRQHSGMILTELRGIPALSGLEVELAHEWLTVHADMATVFITADNKGDWIMRQMPKIRQERM